MLPAQLTVTVTTAGTPVQVSAVKSQCSMIWFINRSSQVMTVGIAGLNKSTGFGVIDDIPAVSGGAESSSNIMKLEFNPMAEYPYDLRDYWIDAASNGGAIDVVYWTL
jgi:hypothetical protein